MLHRKKLMNVLPNEEWNEYVSFVEDCVRRVDEEKYIHSPIMEEVE